MATEITMPKLSDTMTEGRFGSWRKGIGDRVERGDIIAEVETDKAVMELEAFASGILLEQRAAAGDLLAVGAVIGLIGAAGEIVSPVPVREDTSLPPTESIPATVTGESLPVTPVSTGTADPGTEAAAPVVRRRAREMGIDLAQVAGSGPGGRILLEDLERFSGVSIGHADVAVSAETMQAPVAAAETAATASATLMPAGSSPGQEHLPLSRMRAAIARTVSESWRTIPHFYLSVEVAMDAAVEVRRELLLGEGSISLNDLVIKAAALALAKYPQLNSSFVGDGVVLQRDINIGIAVALPDGLLVPVLRGCAGLTLKEIAARTPELVTKARNGQLAASELLGATFSISNLGRYGIESFAAVIHPGQTAILAVGALRECVMVKGGMPAVGKALTLTLSADHRCIDGAYGAEFMRELKTIMETPVRLLV